MKTSWHAAAEAGSIVGAAVGFAVGETVGATVGLEVGDTVGVWVSPSLVGLAEGLCVGHVPQVTMHIVLTRVPLGIP